MADQEDVRRIALGLPQTSEDDGRFAFIVQNKPKPRSFAWVWSQRVHPKKPRIADPDVLAVRVKDEEVKQFLMDANPDVYFTEPHYDGFPAILVRLPNITLDELTLILTEGWRCQAPRSLVAQFDQAD